MARPSRLRDMSLKAVDLDETIDLSASLQQLGMGSPLSLLSPNALGARQPAREGKHEAAEPAGEEVDSLGALPARRVARPARRPDPRRQSLALSSMFAAATTGAGLLDDSEITVGDEDVQVSLAKSSRLLGGGANHSTLWVDPDMGDALLEAELPELPLAGAGTGAGAAGAPAAAATAGGLAAIPESPRCDAEEEPQHCDSPVVTRSGADARPCSAAGLRPAPGVRNSEAVIGGLSQLCAGQQGLDDLDDLDTFQLQDGNRVKEMAFLFKLTAEGQAPPAAAAGSSRQASPAAGGAATAGAGAGGGAAAAGTGAGAQGSGAEMGLSSIREKLRQFHVEQQAPPGADQEPPPGEPSSGGSSPMAAPARAQAKRGSSLAAAPMQPRAPAAAAARKPAGSPTKATRPTGSKLPAQAGRQSRLRQPSGSSGYFSNTVAETCRGAGSRSGSASRAASSSRAGSATTVLARAMAPSGNAAASAGMPAGSAARLAPSASAAAAAAAAKKTPARPAARTPAADNSGRPLVPPRTMAAQPASRIPTPHKPAAVREHDEVAAASPAPAAGSRTAAAPRPATASRLRPAGTPLAAAPRERSATSDGTPAAASQGPQDSAAALTPNAARLRYLEEHPELAFGGGSKLGSSPEKAAGAARKVSAEERHWHDWQEHL